MSDYALVFHTLDKILESLDIILERADSITSVDDFLTAPSGVVVMDSICMKLIAVGESVKNLDKITEKKLLMSYPQIPWKNIMGVRDIIVHHYFDVDADEIFRICTEDIPLLRPVICQIIADLKSAGLPHNE